MMCSQQLPAIMVEVKVVCALGKAFVIGTFFSGHAEKKDRDKVTMVSEHDANKGLSPAPLPDLHPRLPRAGTEEFRD